MPTRENQRIANENVLNELMDLVKNGIGMPAVPFRRLVGKDHVVRKTEIMIWALSLRVVRLGLWVCGVRAVRAGCRQ